jgi:CRISPR-associated protein Cas6
VSTDKVDILFPLQGTTIPFDHSYPLYGAISSFAPHLHQAEWLGIHPIYGKISTNTILLDQSAALRLRLPAENIKDVLCLQGASLRLHEHSIKLGHAQVRMLRPSATLRCYRVSIKGAIDDQSLCTSILGRLTRREIRADISFRKWGAIHIANAGIACFQLMISGLTPAHSLQLQSEGIGGRQRLGCGLPDAWGRQ